MAVRAARADARRETPTAVYVLGVVVRQAAGAQPQRRARVRARWPRRCPQHPMPHVLLAESLLGLQRFGRPRQAYRRAVDARPGVRARALRARRRAAHRGPVRRGGLGDPPRRLPRHASGKDLFWRLYDELRRGEVRAMAERRRSAAAPERSTGPRGRRQVEQAAADEAGPGAEVAAPRRSATFPLGIDYWPLDDEVRARSGLVRRRHRGRLRRVRRGPLLARARLHLVEVLRAAGRPVRRGGRAAARRDRRRRPARQRLQLIVCFFADDRLAELTDVTWGKRRDPRTDPYLIQREVSLVQRIVQLLPRRAGRLRLGARQRGVLRGLRARPRTSTTWVRDAARGRPRGRPRAADHCSASTPRRSSRRPASTRATRIDELRVRGQPRHRRLPRLRRRGAGHVRARDLPRLLPAAPAPAGPAGPARRRRACDSLDYAAGRGGGVRRTRAVLGLMNRGAGAVAAALARRRDRAARAVLPRPDEVLVGVADSEGTAEAGAGRGHGFARVAAQLDLRRYSPQPERCADPHPDERYDPLPLDGPLRSAIGPAGLHLGQGGASAGRARARGRPSPASSRCSHRPPSPGPQERRLGGAAVFRRTPAARSIMSYAGGDCDPRMRDSSVWSIWATRECRSGCPAVSRSRACSGSCGHSTRRCACRPSRFSDKAVRRSWPPTRGRPSAYRPPGPGQVARSAWPPRWNARSLRRSSSVGRSAGPDAPAHGLRSGRRPSARPRPPTPAASPG